MGYNTTLVVMNDALDQIEKDADFGKSVANAIMQVVGLGGARVDIASGNYANAAHVVETHHSSSTAVVTVGGGLGVLRATSHGWCGTEDEQKVWLDAWAEKLGYHLVKNKAIKAE